VLGGMNPPPSLLLPLPVSLLYTHSLPAPRIPSAGIAFRVLCITRDAAGTGGGTRCIQLVRGEGRDVSS
jgi:hypothetical protein